MRLSGIIYDELDTMDGKRRKNIECITRTPVCRRAKEKVNGMEKEMATPAPQHPHTHTQNFNHYTIGSDHWKKFPVVVFYDDHHHHLFF